MLVNWSAVGGSCLLGAARLTSRILKKLVDLPERSKKSTAPSIPRYNAYTRWVAPCRAAGMSRMTSPIRGALWKQIASGTPFRVRSTYRCTLFALSTGRPWSLLAVSKEAVACGSVGLRERSELPRKHYLSIRSLL